MVEKVWIAIWFPFQKQLTLNLLHGGRNIKKGVAWNEWFR